MTIPKIPASTAKLFGKKRMRRQVVVESPNSEIPVAKTVQTPTIQKVEVPVVPPVVSPPAPERIPPMRRRG